MSNVGSVPLVAKLDGLHRPILTLAPRASRYFDDGLQLHYAYRHAESVRAFREAQRLDSTCVMCAVGEAIALGPSVDAAMDSVAAGEATVAARRAQSLLSALPAGHPDSAWVRAITVRYLTGGETRSARDSAYATAMGALADANPADADAQALAAEAQMILSPRNYWGRDGQARPGTRRMMVWLKRGMRESPGHPGACFFYVHAMELINPAVQCETRRGGWRH